MRFDVFMLKIVAEGVLKIVTEYILFGGNENCVIPYVKKQQNAKVYGFYLLKMFGKSVRRGQEFAFSGILNREAV